jgi:hypothetical protein
MDSLMFQVLAAGIQLRISVILPKSICRCCQHGVRSSRFRSHMEKVVCGVLRLRPIRCEKCKRRRYIVTWKTPGQEFHGRDSYPSGNPVSKMGHAEINATP